MMLVMQAHYLARLSPPVRAFVEEVEAVAGFAIDVVEDPARDDKGPDGAGSLSVEVEATWARIYAPTNGYFVDGAVRHEVLHVHRHHGNKVPRLVLAEEIPMEPEFENGLREVDNALEHLVIVPIELLHHPERRPHWEAVLANVWNKEIHKATELDRRIAACLHGSFMRHVLPDSPVMKVGLACQNAYGLRGEAENFADLALPLLGDKVALVKAFFDWFEELPRDWAELNYLNVVAGTTRQQIPD